ARQEDLPWVPKLRYGIMREYLPTRGTMALDMMRRTATVQANLDYESEEDAMRKIRVALRISPIVSAMFANGPFLEGARADVLSMRAKTWLHMDPDRSGLLPFAWKEGATYNDYVEWLLDIPMFMIKRGGRVLHNTGQTFRAFMEDGFEGERATVSDWESHMGTAFPEVRLKKTIEVRGVDGQPTNITCALPALWKGLLYSADALDETEDLTRDFDFETVQAARPRMAKSALDARLYDRPVAHWADRILDIAYRGLAALNHLNTNGYHEGVHLDRLRQLVATGRTPAQALLEEVEAGTNLRDAILEHAKL
ncbi:MAG: glutamate--cysteine ligase, partial [Myxococcales bacterium]|nr:glutamate--cysteine ligase [Myxococcales bacterium]